MRLNRARWVLLVAFALSLLIHLTFALSVRPWRGRGENQVEVVSIVHRPLAMTQLQTPPPPVRATPRPRRSPAARPLPEKARATGAAPGDRGSIAATAAPPPVPTPQAIAAAAGCEKPDADATVVAIPPQPDIPNDVRASGTSGVAAVDVRLDAHADVTSATVSQSTGNSSLDLVAVAMARGATYSPALHACKPVTGNYTFRVRFFAW